MPGSELTIDDLIDALVEREIHRNSHPDLRDYFALRLQLMFRLFGIDLDQRIQELSDQQRAWRLDHNTDPTARYEINGWLTESYFNDCVRLLSQYLTPGGVFLEGMPPKIVRSLNERYGQRINRAIEELKATYVAIIRDLLEFLFPGVSNHRFSERQLVEMGLPATRPDPLDYF